MDLIDRFLPLANQNKHESIIYYHQLSILTLIESVLRNGLGVLSLHLI